MSIPIEPARPLCVNFNAKLMLSFLSSKFFLRKSTEVSDLAIPTFERFLLERYSEGAVPPTVTRLQEKVFFKRYGAPAVPFTLAETPLAVIALFANMEAKS